jgi:RNA polymerase sigma-70 factor (ECF subfamily)
MQLESASPSPVSVALSAALVSSWPRAIAGFGPARWDASSDVTPWRDQAVRDTEAEDSAGVASEPAEDGELVRRCLGGEERAFEALFLRHRGAVTGLVYRMLGPSPELEDLVQDVFIQVLRSLSSFRAESRFSTWLYRVALNVVLMHRRAAGRRPRLVDEERAEPALDEAPSAQEALETRRRVAAFYALLERLSDKKRTVFVLHELEGLTPVRIAELVQAPVLTVRTRLFYARRELARLIEEEPALAELEGLAAVRAGVEGGEEEA